MSKLAAWKELVNKSFRREYKFPGNIQHNWFPGHMHKGLRDMQRRLKDVDCVIEVHDARIPISGRNTTFKNTIHGPRPHILVLNKEDLVPLNNREIITKKVFENDPDVSKVIFTKGKYGGCSGMKSILPTAIRCIENSNRFHRAGCPNKTILIIGIPNVGKSTIINQLRSRHMHVSNKAAPVGAKPGITRAVQERIRVSDDPLVYLLDTPGISKPNIKNLHVGMKLALCHTLNDDVIGEDVISDYLLWWLNSQHNFSYVEYLGLDEPMDNCKLMLAKTAIAAGKFTKMKDFSTGSGTRVLPDIRYAARRFVRGFRGGDLGKIVLDSDLLIHTSLNNQSAETRVSS